MFLTIAQHFVYTNVHSSARVFNWPEFALKISNTICTIGNNLDSQRLDLKVIWYDMIRTDLISIYLIKTTIHWSGCINNQVGSGICFDDLHRCLYDGHHIKDLLSPVQCTICVWQLWSWHANEKLQRIPLLCTKQTRQ